MHLNEWVSIEIRSDTNYAKELRRCRSMFWYSYWMTVFFLFSDSGGRATTTTTTHIYTNSRALRSGQRYNNLWKSLLSLKIPTIRSEITRTRTHGRSAYAYLNESRWLHTRVSFCIAYMNVCVLNGYTYVSAWTYLNVRVCVRDVSRVAYH